MTEILVRVECCHSVAAIIEGGRYPRCPECGEMMVLPEDRNKVLAWVGELGAMPEADAVRIQGRGNPSRGRHYKDSDLAEKREQIAAWEREG